MKLQLSLQLRRALIAALSLMSITIPPAMAVQSIYVDGTEIWTENCDYFSITVRAPDGDLTLDGIDVNTGELENQNKLTLINGAELMATGAVTTAAESTTNIGTGCVFSINSTAASTIGGIITGTGTLNQLGTGKLTLSAANTATGTLSIADGAIASLTSAGSWVGTIALNTSGTIEIARNNATLGIVTGSGTIDIVSGSLSVNAANKNWGEALIQLNGGNMTAPLNATVTNAIHLAKNGTIGVTSSSATLTLSAALTGSMTLTKTGTGTLCVAQANTGFTGNVIVNTGTLLLNDALALGSGDVGLAANTTLGLVSGVTSYGNNITLKGNATLTSNNELAVTSIITGSSSLTTKGKITLSSSNTYTGGTTVNQGILIAANANSLGTEGAITVEEETSLSLKDGLTGTRAFTNNGTVNLIGAASLTSTGTGSYNVNGSINIGGTETAGSLTAGTLSLEAGSTIFFDLGIDSINLTNLAITGDAAADQIIFNFNTTEIENDTYTLISFTDAEGISEDMFNISFESEEQVFSFELVDGQLQLVVGDSNLDILWNGTAENSIWDNSKDNKVWFDAENLDKTEQFAANRAVIFTDAAESQHVTIMGEVEPGAITVTGGNYSFIAGDADAEISGEGMMLLSGENTSLSIKLSNNNYTGEISIEDGASLLADAANALGTGDISITSGTLSATQADFVSNKISINASGDVVFQNISGENISSLSITAGASVSGVMGAITLDSASIELNENNLSSPALSFEGSGTLNLGQLSLIIVDETLSADDLYTFQITNGTLAGDILTVDSYGTYTNIIFTGNSDYVAVDVSEGNVSFALRNVFHLDEENNASPAIQGANQAIGSRDKWIVSDSSYFKYLSEDGSTYADFESVKVDGALVLQGENEYTINNLNGSASGSISLEGATAKLVINDDTVFAGMLSGDSDSEFIKSGEGTFTLESINLDGSLTIEEGIFKLTHRLGTTSQVKDLTIGEDGALHIASSTLTVSGNATLSGIVEGHGVLIVEGASQILGTTTIDTSAESDTIVYDGTLKGSGTIGKIGEGSLILDNVATFSTERVSLEITEGTVILTQHNKEASDKTTYFNQVYVDSGNSLYLNGGATVNAEQLTITNNGRVVLSEGTQIITDKAVFGTGSGEGALLEYTAVSSDQAAIIANSYEGFENLTVKLDGNVSGWSLLLKQVILEGDASTDYTGFENITIDINGVDHAELMHDIANNNIYVQAILSDGENTSAYLATTHNSLSGADMLWNANLTQAALGNSLVDAENNTALSSLVKAAQLATLAADSASYSQLMSAAAGSTVTALNASLKADFRMQNNWIRNRVTQMGQCKNLASNQLQNSFASGASGVRAGEIVVEEAKWNVWGQANSANTHLSQKGDMAGFSNTVWGGTFGVDRDMNNELTLGAAFTANWGKLSSSAVGESARGHSNTNYINFFARYQEGSWTHAFIATLGFGDATFNRTVAVPGVYYNTRGTTDSTAFGFMYELTYDYSLNAQNTAVLQPVLNISYSNTKYSNYNETGADGAGLKVRGLESDYLSIALGARIMGIIKESTHHLPEAFGEFHILLSQDFGDNENEAQTGLLGGNNYRSVKGAKVGSTGLQIGGGITQPLTENTSIYINTDLDFRSKATNINGNVGLRYSF